VVPEAVFLKSTRYSGFFEKRKIERKKKMYDGSRVDSLIRQLPPPHARYCDRVGTIFEVYRVKSLGDHFWRDPLLKELLIKTRDSYRRYGVRTSLDQYDVKAAIYLVRVMYHSEEMATRVEEWISVRVVPGNGNPLGAGELEIYFYEGKRMDYWVRKKLGCGQKVFWSRVLSNSRMCGIRPFVSGASDKGETNYRLGHKYTAVCNAIISTQFIIDTNYLFPGVITGILRDDLHEKGLRVSFGSEEAIPTFTKAHEFLGIPQDAVKLNRGTYAYEFPSYWLDVAQLINLLERLQREDRISEEGLEYYLRGSLPSNLNNLGALLTVAGTIHASKMTGEELRALVDEHVQEKPSLRITYTREWFESYLRVLQVAGVDMFDQNPELLNFLPPKPAKEGQR